MKAMAWFVALGALAAVVYGIWRMRAKWEERSRAAEARMASFMASTLPAPSAPKEKATEVVVQQRLLLEAASKAGEAGEPALAIQLYARLLTRYPQTSFAEQARAAVEVQKKKLAPKPAA